MHDLYKTILQPAEGYVTEKKSKFISAIHPVKSAGEAKSIVDECRKKHYGARHVCWAYVLGPDRADFRANDDGEPSGTAGRPILGQINSHELTNVLILVVRYFGGTLLGASGLIKAYKEAAAAAIGNAEIVEETVDENIAIRFDYVLLNEVMRVLKQFEHVHWTQDFNEDCIMRLQIRKSLAPQLSGALGGIHGVSFMGD